MIHDLKDFNAIDVETNLISALPGSSGSWEEPASAPEFEYTITSLAFEDWTEECPRLEIGDQIQVSCRCYLDIYDEEAHVYFNDTLTIKKIDFKNDDEGGGAIFLKVESPIKLWHGKTPRQSFRGWTRDL